MQLINVAGPLVRFNNRHVVSVLLSKSEILDLAAGETDRLELKYAEAKVHSVSIAVVGDGSALDITVDSDGCGWRNVSCIICKPSLLRMLQSEVESRVSVLALPDLVVMIWLLTSPPVHMYPRAMILLLEAMTEIEASELQAKPQQPWLASQSDVLGRVRVTGDYSADFSDN